MPPTPAQSSQVPDNVAGPPTVWLGAGFLLAGLGTVLLGPILPTVSARWHLTDAAAGSLLFAKFLGAFLGGATVPRRLRFGLLNSTLIVAAGLTGFAFAPNPWIAGFTLFLAGFGLGHLIASSNILAGRRYATHTGSALSTLNFFWSLGAVGTGLLTAWLLPRLPLATLVEGVAAAFLVVGLGGATGWLFRPNAASEVTAAEPRRLPTRTLLLFASLLLLYGGLETSLSSWLTTFDERYIEHHLLGGQSALVLLWASLTVGRALAAAALRRWPERLVLRASLAAAVVLIVALATAHGSLPLSAICVLLGLSLAPWFPATFALLLAHQPTSREAGLVLATSAIGAAIFPWLTGILSTQTGSLRFAMSIPAALAALLLLASFLPERNKIHTS